MCQSTSCSTCRKFFTHPHPIITRTTTPIMHLYHLLYLSTYLTI